MFERFTDRARRVLVLAQEEARLLNHGFIGTEHLLLGMLHEGEAVAAKALEMSGISLETARVKVEQMVGRNIEPVTGAPQFTPRAKKVLELSLRTALQLGHNYIGTEHMLLGLVREGESVGAQVIKDLGVELSEVRFGVMQLLSGQLSYPAEPALTLDPISFVARTKPSGNPPDCPHCRASLDASVRYHRMKVNDDAGEHTLLVIFCGECGRALAFRPSD
jgi:ATP-dependent Clp protease ATP-binding subunit ClpC